MNWFRSIPFMHVVDTQFLNDPRQYASSSVQQTTALIHHEIPPMYTSQFGSHTSSSAQQTYHHTQTTQQLTFYATSSQHQTPHTPIPQINYYYNQHYQQQTGYRPPIKYISIPQPNFDYSNLQSKHQTFKTAFSQPTSTFNLEDVYYPPIYQTLPDTFT